MCKDEMTWILSHQHFFKANNVDATSKYTVAGTVGEGEGHHQIWGLEMFSEQATVPSGEGKGGIVRDGRVHTAIFKMDTQQGTTVWNREIEYCVTT